MDKQIIISLLIYIAGYLLCRMMLKIEHESEKGEWTKGNVIVFNVLCMLSFLMVLWMLVAAWVSKISSTGYFKKPVKNK